MQAFVAALIAAGTALTPHAADVTHFRADGLSGPLAIQRVSDNPVWSGSWIWTPENRKWVDPNNRASVELLSGKSVRYCYNSNCSNVNFGETNGVYHFALSPGGSSKTMSFYEFWLGDNGSLEGRFWLNRDKHVRRAPDAMIRMTH